MDLADSLQKEIDILNEYLPEELSDEELEKIVKETITKVKAESIKQMGMVIKTISSEYGARCDMAKVSKLTSLLPAIIRQFYAKKSDIARKSYWQTYVCYI